MNLLSSILPQDVAMKLASANFPQPEVRKGQTWTDGKQVTVIGDLFIYMPEGWVFVPTERDISKRIPKTVKMMEDGRGYRTFNQAGWISPYTSTKLAALALTWLTLNPSNDEVL